MLSSTRAARCTTRRYCLDPRHFEVTPFGNTKTSARRARFLLQTLQDLKSCLQKLGSDLLVARGKPEELLPTLATLDLDRHQTRANRVTILAHAEVTSEETKVERAVECAMEELVSGSRGVVAGASMELLWGSTLYHRDDVPFEVGGMPRGDRAFTRFRKKVQGRATVCHPIPEAVRLACPHRGQVARARAVLTPTHTLVAAAGIRSGRRCRHLQWARCDCLPALHASRSCW